MSGFFVYFIIIYLVIKHGYATLKKKYDKELRKQYFSENKNDDAISEHTFDIKIQILSAMKASLLIGWSRHYTFISLMILLTSLGEFNKLGFHLNKTFHVNTGKEFKQLNAFDINSRSKY